MPAADAGHEIRARPAALECGEIGREPGESPVAAVGPAEIVAMDAQAECAGSGG